MVLVVINIRIVGVSLLISVILVEKKATISNMEFKGARLGLLCVLMLLAKICFETEGAHVYI